MGKKINVTIDVEEFSKNVAEGIMNQLKEKMETCATDCESIRKAIEGLNDDEFLIYANDVDEKESDEKSNIERYDEIIEALSNPVFDDREDIDSLFEWVCEKRHREMLYGEDECVSEEELNAIIVAAQHFKQTGDIKLYETLMNLYDRKHEN